MTYDLNGNLLSATDANGNGTQTAGDGTTSYAYDRSDRLTSVDYSDTTPDVTFGYDSVGNRVSMTDGAGTQTRAYDNLDRLVSVTRGPDTFSYAYDPAGNVTKRTYPDGSVVDYTYDPLGRMSTVANAGRTVTYVYDAASNLVTTTLPSFNQYVETRTYDRAGRLTELKNQRPPGVLSDYVWQLDPVGNPLSETDSGASPSTRSYTYDAMDRLTSVCFQTGGCPGGSDPFVRWSYDGVGNRLTEQRPGGTTAYTYDAMDRMLTAGSTAFTYDRNGNRLTAGTRTFTWDLAGRLLSTHVPGQTSSYTYDGDGNRLMSVDGGGDFNTTLYQWDLNRPLPMLARESIGTGSLHRRYINGLQPLWWTTKTDDSSVYYFHRDPLGSVRGISSKGGGTTATYDYEPFGTLRSQTGSIANPNRFAGYYHDSETDLYYLHARQYDPQVGGFLSRDPAGQTIGGGAISPYLYAGDQPTVMIDPSGETLVSSAQSAQTAAYFASDRWPGTRSPAASEGVRFEASTSTIACSSETAHSFSWRALTPSCAFRAIKEDLTGQNPAFTSAALLILPVGKALTVIEKLAGSRVGVIVLERIASSPAGKALGRKMIAFAKTNTGARLIGNKAYQGRTGVLNTGRIRIGIGRTPRGRDPVFRIGIGNKHIDF